MGSACFILADSDGTDCDASLQEMRIRRCRGCVRCLTEHPGICEIDDGFTELIPVILAHSELRISVAPEHGKVPDRARKAIERLSNILDAYTDRGGNVPLPTDSVDLRRITVAYRGNFEDRMESEITGALRKGPVSDVDFIYFENRNGF